MADYAGPPTGGDGRFMRDPKVAERDAKATELRADGWTYARIAAELGYADGSHARLGVTRALRDVQAPSVEKLRRLEGDRLEHVVGLLLDVAEMNGAPITSGKDGLPVYDPDTGVVARDFSGRINAARALVAASQRIAALYGLDEPVKAEIGANVTVRYSFGPGIGQEDLT